MKRPRRKEFPMRKRRIGLAMIASLLPAVAVGVSTAPAFDKPRSLLEVDGDVVLLDDWAGSHRPRVSDEQSMSTTPGQPSVWRIVALGDSDTTGEGDRTGLGWVGRYARLLRQKLGLNVEVTNLAVNGQTSDDLLGDVHTDRTTRQALKEAHIILIGSGGADLGAGDERLEAGRCAGTACYEAVLARFAHNLDAAATGIRKLRSGRDAVLRAITLPNVVPGARDVTPPFITDAIGVYQTKTLKRSICAAMKRHAGRCVDALLAFNGSRASANAYSKGLVTKNPCCYPSGKGQQLIAELVFKSGLKPLR
jgi:lysophospholipase L1-like esterase